MTLGELLVGLGLAWQRLLLYPGGALLLAALAICGWRRGGWRQPRGTAPSDSIGIVYGWLACALLPLPGAAPLARPVDLLLLVGLAELPRLLALAADLRAGDARRAVRRAAAALNAYPPLIAAALALLGGCGSLALDTVATGPANGAPLAQVLRYAAGSAALLLALPALLELGPLAPGPAAGGSLPRRSLALTLRGLALAGVAALPLWAGLRAGQAAVAWWLLPLPPLIIAGWLWRAAAWRSSQRRAGWALLALTGLCAASALLG